MLPGGWSLGGLGGLFPEDTTGAASAVYWRSGGGLSAILDQLREYGFGNAVDSLVAHGENQRLAPDQLAEALGPETVDELARHTGMERQDVLHELAGDLPAAVDELRRMDGCRRLKKCSRGGSDAPLT
jgi:uncharacterized protein YidB (DUF937 family)